MADDQALPAKPDTNEIASSLDGRDITRPFFGPLLEHSDTVLRGLGSRWEAYREIRRDGQVHATFQQRRLAVVARPLVVEPGAKDARSVAAAKQLEANLAAIAFDRASKGMAWGLFYGFSVGECMWEIRDGKVWLSTVKVRTPWRFRFTPAGELRLLTRRSMFDGEQLPERKFWVMASGADNDDDPYGLGLAHQLYWPVYFKKNGLAFWLRALEKFGAPTAVGTYQPGTSKEDQAKLLAAAMAIRIDGAVIKPEGTLLELLEANRGTVDQATFHRQMNGEVSKIVLGQTMTTDDGASLAQGKVHFDVREELTDADVEELCESFQQGPARWLTEWNFPGAAIPIIRRPSPEDAERASKLTKERAETVDIMGRAGYEPDEATLQEMFPGWRKKLVETPPPTQLGHNGGPPLDPAFAEPDGRDAIDAFVDELDWQPIVEPVIARVTDLVLGAPSLQVAADRLAALFAEPATGVEALARAVFQARLAGEGGIGLSRQEARDIAAED
jgi:phage gp29-like protein